MTRVFIIAKFAFVLCFLYSCDNLIIPKNYESEVEADNYESDDTKSNAKIIKPDNVQNRTLEKGDTDWVSFPVTAGHSYRMFTTGNVLTKISLYNGFNEKPFKTSVDIPNTINAYIDYNSSINEIIYASIYGRDKKITGPYDLSLITVIYPDLYEPDSAPSILRTIRANFEQNRTIHPGDIDWVNFHTNESDSILLTAEGNCSLLVKLYNVDTSQVLATSTIIDSSTQIRCWIPNMGTYFVRITTQNSLSACKYTLRLRTASSGSLIIPDSFENDNTINNAKLFPKDCRIQKHTAMLGDTDWVIIPVEQGYHYSLFPCSDFPGVDTTIYYALIYAKNGTLLQGPSQYLSFNCIMDDSIYAKIYSTYNSPLKYELCLDVFLQPSIKDQYENDNTKDQVKYFASDSLSQDRTLTTVNSIADTDWIAFPVYVGKIYYINTFGQSNRHPLIYRFGKTSTSYLDYSSSGSISFKYLADSGNSIDTMYVMVCSSDSIPTAYYLGIYGYYQNDYYEPDSSRALAKELTGIQKRIFVNGDTDWVKYTAQPGDSFILLTTGMIDTKLSLFSSTGSTPLVENDNIDKDNKNAAVSFKSIYAGEYYLCVTPKHSNSGGYYTLEAFIVKDGKLIPD